MNKYIILVILFGLCFSSSLSNQEKFFCKQCHRFVHTIQKVEHFWDKSIVWFLELVAEGYCAYAKIEKHSVCKGAIHEMTPVIFEGIQTRYLDEDFICPLIRWCPKVYEELKLEDYISNILKDKPLNTQWPQLDGTDTIEIIHVSDILEFLKFLDLLKPEFFNIYQNLILNQINQIYLNDLIEFYSRNFFNIVYQN